MLTSLYTVEDMLDTKIANLMTIIFLNKSISANTKVESTAKASNPDLREAAPAAEQR